MKKANLTYTAAKGESKTLEIAGVTLLSGESKEIHCDDHLMGKLEAASKTSASIKVSGVSDYTPPPPKPEPKEDSGKAESKSR